MTDFPAPPPAPEWATYIPTRSTKSAFVVHKRLGDAKNALNAACYDWSDGARGDMQLLRWTGGEWVVTYDIKKGTRATDLPWRKK